MYPNGGGSPKAPAKELDSGPYSTLKTQAKLSNPAKGRARATMKIISANQDFHSQSLYNCRKVTLPWRNASDQLVYRKGLSTIRRFTSMNNAIPKNVPGQDMSVKYKACKNATEICPQLSRSSLGGWLRR